MLAEGVDEFVDAVAAADLGAIADELADIVYVSYGTAVTYGIDLDMVLSEVHRSAVVTTGPAGQRPAPDPLSEEEFAIAWTAAG